MPSKKTKKSERRQWWTVAHFSREGVPVAIGFHPFSQVYRSERVLLEDLTYDMKNFAGQRGAYAVMAWSGQVSEYEAINTKTPKFTVYENGDVHVHT